ncbi:hypothetical protein Hanom_Chr12g01096431 [Helianthus anomalus]
MCYCYVFTLLLHIKIDVKQPQGLCIVPNLEGLSLFGLVNLNCNHSLLFIQQRDLQMRTPSELPDTSASTCFKRPMRLRGDKTNMLFHQVGLLQPRV